LNIFRRSLSREFTAVGMSVLVVLTTIFLIITIIRLLGRVAEGLQDPEAVIALLGFGLLAYLPVILSLSMFIAVLLTLSRGYRDSEMPIWFSAGLPLTAWVRPVLAFGVPIALVTALLSLVLTPWALTQSEEYQRLLRSRDDVSRLTPGNFMETRNANQVFFVDKSSGATNTVNNVFVQFNQHGRFGVVVAEKGFPQTAPNGDRFLVLLNGRRYEGTPSALDFQITDFERWMIRLDSQSVAAGEVPVKALGTFALLFEPTPERLAEFHWRIALPMVAMVLSLIAIPLSFVNPRSGTSWNLILAILIFFLYYNLLGIFQAWTASARIPAWIGLTPVHIGMLAILLGLFWRQLFGFRWLAMSKK
jgi:lipopolysaccharide export system permease protein